ncbi:MAG: 30S ribosomal protein S17 [Deltaproteobacteria bacterium]|nr:MAG: 30S ribosomal protein S17 [Deltaproteobacteria bacterium]
MTQRGVRKRLVGVVVGNKMDKTAAVLVSRLKKHRTYKKYVRSQTKYMAHDPQNRCLVGDRVRIIETRPISKRKRWQVIDIIERSVIEESGQENSSSLEQER